jgi:3-deoxy-D-manno-octulosonic acid (KDO) 8-phosphate synthase
MEIKINNFTVGKNHQLFFILGPCVIESEKHTLFMAEEITRIAIDLQIPFIFKASFDKANRSSIHSFRGVEIKKGMKILSVDSIVSNRGGFKFDTPPVIKNGRTIIQISMNQIKQKLLLKL